jgi:hypothetical protein
VETFPTQRNSIAGGVVVLVLRGVLLWLVVPIAVLAWPIVRSRLRKSGVSLGQYLGWIDLNLVACLQRLATPILVRHPIAWTPRANLAQVTHRLRATDPV